MDSQENNNAISLEGMALARGRDPSTSFIAAQGVNVARDKRRVLTVMRELRADHSNPVTDDQIYEHAVSEFAGVSAQSMRSRRKELMAAGLVECVDRDGRSAMGNRCRRFALTEDGAQMAQQITPVEPVEVVR